MSDATARLALPMIVPGQAQKEMTHNEALAILDIAVQASVVAIGLDVPPVDPGAGACWIVGNAPSGAWAGHARHLAAWTSGGWRFVPPRPGFRAWVVDADAYARFVDGAWVVETAVDAIPGPSGGATVDAPARDAIVAILAALRHHNLVLAP